MNKNIATLYEVFAICRKHGSQQVRIAIADGVEALKAIAELEARTPAAPVVAEGLTDKLVAAACWGVRPDDFREPDMEVDYLRYDGAVVRAYLAAHPVAGSPAEADEVPISRSTFGSLEECEKEAARRRARAAEPMPASEAAGRLTDEQISDCFNGVDFSSMVTADDIFYLIARAVESRLAALLRQPMQSRMILIGWARFRTPLNPRPKHPRQKGRRK